MKISDQHARYLLTAIRSCNAVLVLGAGASHNSTNRSDEPIKMGGQLAELLAKRAGFIYAGESLADTYEAVRGVLGDVVIYDILKRGYTGTTPSQSLSELFDISWKRVYTFNIDDTIDAIPFKRIGQRRRYTNGLQDKLSDFDLPLYTQVVYLHGQAIKPEHGFIFSKTDYAIAVRNTHLHWYNRAGTDYISSCSIFVGSQLDDPVLWAEVERAKREEAANSGVGFVITPNNLTPIIYQSLLNRGIIHIPATLEELVAWLRVEFPSGYTPSDVNSYKTNIKGTIEGITQNDINAVSSLRWIDPQGLKQNLSLLSVAEVDHRGKLLLKGFPPSWMLAASSIPVWLSAANDILAKLSASIQNGNKLFLVIGQAGSGKTTALMTSLLRFLETSTKQFYELTGENSNLPQIFSVLRKLNHPCIVYVSDLLLYGDALADELEKMPAGEITFVTSARTSEWTAHFPDFWADFAILMTSAGFLLLITVLLSSVSLVTWPLRSS